MALSEERTGVVVWLTGLSGAGKSTLARLACADLERQHVPMLLLDSDRVRLQISAELGFSDMDRREHLRRLSILASGHAAAGRNVLVAAISPSRQSRQEARARTSHFLEIFVDAPLATCIARDPAGLYRRFHEGEVRNLAGLDATFDIPLAPDVHCKTAEATPQECAQQIVEAVMSAVRRSTLRNAVPQATRVEQ